MKEKNIRIIGNTLSDVAHKCILTGILCGACSAIIHFVADGINLKNRRK